jgi:hypothetical protein
MPAAERDAEAEIGSADPNRGAAGPGAASALIMSKPAVVSRLEFEALKRGLDALAAEMAALRDRQAGVKPATDNVTTLTLQQAAAEAKISVEAAFGRLTLNGWLTRPWRGLVLIARPSSRWPARQCSRRVRSATAIDIGSESIILHSVMLR